MKLLYSCLFFFSLSLALAQEKATLRGQVTSENQPVAQAQVEIVGTALGTQTDSLGFFEIPQLPLQRYTLRVAAIGIKTHTQSISSADFKHLLKINVVTNEQLLDEVVVSGTMKAVRRLENPVPVEIISTTFLKQNPTASVFEGLQNVNGLRPQNNCNVCNTGDIRINGLDGPYTMVTIDGMPIVSALGTVYGLSGIPNAMIDKIEIIKGAASSLYGSEAVGGLINIITKKPQNAPQFTADLMTTSWLENSLDLGYRTNIGKKSNALFGLSTFYNDYAVDNNGDNFTDIALQKRVSFFSRWHFERRSKKEMSLVARYLYEDRWGGEMQWNSSFRGGDQVYGESIYTSRYEILGKYQLPVDEKMSLQFSMVGHDQNSVYSTSVFLANQKIAFGQYLWDKELQNHSLLFGAAARFTWYNDNTPATATSSQTAIYSGFLQDDIQLSKQTGLLLGARYDYHPAHGSIVTPRLALKWKPTATDILRLNLGTGFRVVNLFTEDHQALSGAREVVLKGDLDPETSYTANLNYLKKFDTNTAGVLTLEASTWYTHFKNRIIADYDTNPNQIIYANLDGFSRIFGSSISLDWVSPFGVKGTLGGSYFNPLTEQEGRRFVPLFTEKVSLSWALSYEIPNWFLNLDYTGSYTGSMRLPLLSPLDPRREYSLPYSIQNIQITYKKFHKVELFGGVKNLLNWTPNRGNPFLIARANDPFDKQVTFDSNGVAQPTPDNPYALTFDPTYAYGPNQGIRAFVGLRWHLD